VGPGVGTALEVGEPTSADELFVLETDLDPRLAIRELARRVCGWGERPLELDARPATELAGLALGIRRSWLGDTLWARSECQDPDCREAVDVSFSISEYIAHHQPRRARAAIATAESGWYALRDTDLRFRAPSIGDLARAINSGDPAGTLAERCVTGPEPSSAQVRRIDRALTTLSPPLDGALGGVCPACGRSLSLRFDPCAFVLAELRDAFAGIYYETHLIAASYGWDEDAILRLPRARRRRYAAFAAPERAAG
jgi:hypothetical protein